MIKQFYSCKENPGETTSLTQECPQPTHNSPAGHNGNVHQQVNAWNNHAPGKRCKWFYADKDSLLDPTLARLLWALFLTGLSLGLQSFEQTITWFLRAQGPMPRMTPSPLQVLAWVNSTLPKELAVCFSQHLKTGLWPQPPWEAGVWLPKAPVSKASWESMHQPCPPAFCNFSSPEPYWDPAHLLLHHLPLKWPVTSIQTQVQLVQFMLAWTELNSKSYYWLKSPCSTLLSGFVFLWQHIQHG